MFFKSSPEQKKIKKAKDLISLGKKVFNYRRDLLSHDNCQELVNARDALKAILKNKDVSSLDSGTDRLDKIMKKCGGRIYPVTFWADNAEVFLVAAILALGIRTFFLQTFEIPTNSMYPTYNGMTSKVYNEQKAEPNPLQRFFNVVWNGTDSYHLESNATGTLRIPLFTSHGGAVRYERAMGRKLLFFKKPLRHYTFFVGDTPHTIQVPWDFGLEDTIVKQHFSDLENFTQLLERATRQQTLELTSRGLILDTGIPLKPGDNILNFDIIAGDKLFVDRFSYHFRKPKIGETIVFRANKIEDLRRPDGSPEEKYFIKRMVGKAGDELQVQSPFLYRNGKPISGSEAFDLNHNRVGEYPGYSYLGRLGPGKIETVPNGRFFGMGDNSPNSGDSRVWGPVLETELVGRPVFIFYPFGQHFGPAK